MKYDAHKDKIIEVSKPTHLMQQIKLYLDHGITQHRSITPKRMRAIATEYTGVEYKRSRKGLELAYDDLLEMKYRMEEDHEQIHEG